MGVLSSVMPDMRTILEKSMDGLTWNISGIVHSDNTISSLPPESRVVTELLQSAVIRRLLLLPKTYPQLSVTDYSQFGRSYPDAAINWNGDLHAIDVKSARVVPTVPNRITRMTLGTYNGYFLHPNEKKLHNNKYCYNDYHQHWVIALIYHWKPRETTQNMVTINSVCVGQKWQFAGTVAGSGDTANIGGITSLRRLQTLDSVFANNEKFEQYWRDYAKKHPRKRTQIS